MKFQTKLRPALFSMLFSTLFISLYAQKSSNFSIDLSTNFIQDLGFDSFKDHLLDQPSLRLNWTNPKFSLGAEVGIIKDRVTTLFDEYPRIMGAVADLDVNSDSWKHTYLILGPSLNLINNRWLQLGIGVKAGFNFLQESPDLIIRDQIDADRVYQQYLPAAEKKMEFLFKPALELQVFPGGGNFGFNFSTAYLNINPANTSRSTGLDLSGINVPDDLPDPDQIRKTLTRFERVESTQEPIDKSLTFSAGITYKIGGSKKTTPPKKDIPLPKDKDKDIIAGNEGQNQNKSSEALCNCDPFGAGGSALPEVVRLYKEMPYVYNVIPPPPIHMFYAVCYPGYNLTSNMNIIWDYGFDPISGSGDINMNGKYSLYHAEPEEITSEIFAIAPWPDTDTCHHTVKIPIPTPPECGAIVGGVPEPELDLIAHDTTNSNLRTLHNLQAKADFLLANNGWSTPTQEIYSFVQWTPVDGVHEGYQTAPTDSINHTFAASDFTNFGHSKVEYWVWEGSDFVCRKTYNVFYSNDTLWQKLYAGENGEFEIKNDVDSLYTYTAGVPFSGTGTAYIPGVVTTVEVEFQDIKADQLGNLVEGEILAKVDPSAPVYAKEWLLGAAGTLAGLDHDMVQDVLEWSDSNLVDVPFLGTSGPMAPLGDPAVNMPMILELDNASDSRFAITEMVFLPNQSKFNAMLALAAPAEWNAVEMLGFIAKGVRFHPTSLESPPDRIEIVDDILINNATDDISFRFKKAAVPYDPFHQGCYIAWDEDGFSQFGVELAAEFTRDWFTPIPDDSISKSTVTLVGTGAAWNDIILTGTWEKSQIEDAHGMTIEALNLNLDLSDSFNPVGMTFPLTYGSVTDTTSLWRGFYGESLTLELPPSWETNTGGPPAVGVQQVFIDDQGVTLEAFAHNVIAWPDADISDLNASVDTISVQFLMNSLTEAHVIGQIGLPASHPDSIQNPLKYHGYWLDSAAIALDTVFALAGPGSPEGGSMFALTIEPTGPINANLLKGDLLLEPTSMITAYKQDTVKYFGMNLDGSLAYVDKKLGPLKNINMEFGFQGLGFEYSNLDSLTFDLGTWSLASPQKKAHGFPLTVNSISFDPLPKTPGQKLHGSLDFDVTFSLGDTSSAISATSAFGIEFEILEDLVNDVKFKPHYLGLNLDSLAVTANLAAVNIAGYLTIDSDHAIYGKRITGGLSAYFKGPGIGATVDGVFGNTSYNHYEAYKYWSVDVGVVFGSAIPFLSGLGFYGFSGGAYGNMLLNLVETAPDVYAKTYTPDFGNLGFRAGATIGTMPLQDAFNADIQLEALFSTTGGGIQYIGFEGAFGTNAKIADRRIGKGKINGNLLTFYDFPNKHFYLGASATINSPPITTPSPISLALDINGLTSDWYFVCGKPDYDPPAPHLMNEVNLNFDSTGVGINLYEYFMFGNSIPYPNGFTYKFRDAYYDQLGSYPGFGSSVGPGGVDSNSELGKGMALGIGFQFDKSGEAHITGKYYLGYELAAGAEVNLSYMRYAGGCGTDPYHNPIGTNGWRAKGNLGLYAVAAARVDKKDNSGNVEKTWNIADLRAGAWITGEFPNPHYAAGAIDGQAQIGHWVGKMHPLGHWNPNFPWLWQESCDHYVDKYLLNVNIHKEFEVGEACTNAADNTTPVFTQENVTDDFDDILIRHVSPLQNYNFPEISPITVGFNFVPDEIFHVSELQSSGAIINRTFKLQFTRNLKRKTSSGVWVNAFTSYQVNDLGEYQYILLPPISAAPAPLSALASPFTGSGISAAPAMLSSAIPGSGGMPGYATLSPALAPLVGAPSLPPPPPPPLVNTLSSNTYYRFTVNAELLEYNYGTLTWSTVIKSDGQPLTDSVIKTFRTGPMEPVTILSGSLSTY